MQKLDPRQEQNVFSKLETIGGIAATTIIEAGGPGFKICIPSKSSTCTFPVLLYSLIILYIKSKQDPKSFIMLNIWRFPAMTLNYAISGSSLIWTHHHVTEYST